MSDMDRTIARFFGALLMGVGGLIALLSGGCTLTVALASLGSLAGGGGADLANILQWIFTMGTVGGIPIAIGVGLFMWGRSLWGPRPRRQPGPGTGPDLGGG